MQASFVLFFFFFSLYSSPPVQAYILQGRKEWTAGTEGQSAWELTERVLNGIDSTSTSFVLSGFCALFSHACCPLSFHFVI
jgi:hypothetical protein